MENVRESGIRAKEWGLGHNLCINFQYFFNFSSFLHLLVPPIEMHCAHFNEK